MICKRKEKTRSVRLLRPVYRKRKVKKRLCFMPVREKKKVILKKAERVRSSCGVLSADDGDVDASPAFPSFSSPAGLMLQKRTSSTPLSARYAALMDIISHLAKEDSDSSRGEESSTRSSNDRSSSTARGLAGLDSTGDAGQRTHSDGSRGRRG